MANKKAERTTDASVKCMGIWINNCSQHARRAGGYISNLQRHHGALAEDLANLFRDILRCKDHVVISVIGGNIDV